MTAQAAITDFVVTAPNACDDERLTREAIQAISDGVASLVGGIAEPLSKIVHANAERAAAPDAASRAPSDASARLSSIVNRRDRVPTGLAALTNAVAGHALCFDDNSPEMMGHPTIVVLPASLAVAESVNATGRDLVDAYCIGVEVAVRLGQAIAPGHMRAGWHATGTAGAIGAAAAAARLLKLDRERTSFAIGIAASGATGLRSNFGTMTMIYHAGQAARVGVEAAELAETGLTSSPTALDGEIGFLALQSGEGALGVHPEPITSIGDPYALVSPGLEIKPYPCGALGHRAIQAVIDARGKSGFDPEDVVGIECTLPGYHLSILEGRPVPPGSVLEARISLVYPIAVAALKGRCGVGDFDAQTMSDPELHRLMRLVRSVADESTVYSNGVELFTAPAVVRISLANGSTIQQTCTDLKGSPANPMSPVEFHAKFDECVSRLFNTSRSARIWAALYQLPDAPDLHGFTGLLRGE